MNVSLVARALALGLVFTAGGCGVKGSLPYASSVTSASSTNGFLSPQSTVATPLSISRSAGTLVTVNNRNPATTQPFSTAPNCATASVVSAGSSSTFSIVITAAAGAAPNCGAAITVSAADGSTGTEYVVVP